MIKLELRDPKTGKIETFTENFVSARSLRKILEYGVKEEKREMTDLESMDEAVTLIADIFSDDRVTFDSIYDGIASDQIGPVLHQLFMDVMGGKSEKKSARASKK